MKRMVSFLLAAALILTPAAQVLAVEPAGSAVTEGNQPEGNSGKTNQNPATADKPGTEDGLPETGPDGQEEGNPAAGEEKQPEFTAAETGQNTETEPKTEAADAEGADADSQAEGSARQNLRTDMGQVHVSVGAAVILEKEISFTVELTGQTSQTITLPSDKDCPGAEKTVSFEKLPEGNYTLRVTAPGFTDYTQDIEVRNRAYTVTLLTGFVAGYTYERGVFHPGVLLIGDVEKDGIIDDRDRDKLVNAIDAGVSSVETDVNGDGLTDLADLEYFSRSYQEEGDTEAFVENSISTDAITPEAGVNTKVEGNLTDLLTGGGSVLASAAGGEISESNPVILEFHLAEDADTQADGILIETSKANPIARATVDITYMDADGTEGNISIPVEKDVQYLLKDSDAIPFLDGNGNMQIHLGSQIAVKKVTLTIKGMQNNNNLAEISKVQFLNGMESRIPKPQMDIPQNLAVEEASREFVVTWDPCKNITGYEVLISSEGKEETWMAKAPILSISSFQGKELVNKTEYQVRVQSVNGTWRSGYSDAVTAVPRANKVPDAPDNVQAVGRYKSIDVSWKKMKDTEHYRLFYRESDSGDAYQVIEGITENRYTITELKDKTRYELYLTGVNELGEGKPSLKSVAQTESLEPAQMPEYKLINTAEEGTPGSSITGAVRGRGEMKDSPLDTEGKTAWGMVDHNPASYYYAADWDEGSAYPDFNNKGFTFAFDQTYTIDTIGFQELYEQGNFSTAVVEYRDEESGQFQRVSGVKVERRSDRNGKHYYFIRLADPVRTNQLRFGVGKSNGYIREITISEVYFYHYDSLEDDIMGLYEDDLHMVLKAEVDQKTIDTLRTRLNTQDSVSGEYHPDRERLERELKNAEEILNNELGSPIGIHNTITTKDVGRGFGGLNAWQPLGITAAAGEEITIFVGHSALQTGANTNLQLVATQYHAESSPMSTTVATLKVGRNDITLPQIGSTAAERGGALYIQYTGNQANDQYAVRVNGGVEVPRLDLYQTTDPAERLARTEKYVEELKVYTAQVEAMHEELHQNSENALVKYSYDEKNCILEASDILMDSMMLSIPAKQILAGCGQNAQTLLDSLNAMEEMMYLFYQHKGLNKDAKDEIDRLPKGHLNIRYQRMFAGAFMYASGNHIGVEWNETKGLAGAKPVQSVDGRYESGQYFGWGVAHEIGHNINQGAYAIAEITNNYFAQLAQAKDTDESVRFKYPNIYEKVTSGTIGRSPNGATQLGMYWQLHLAYDDGYNYKTYENYEEQLGHLFFARVDTYARTPAKAPAPGGILLKLSGDKDQDLMRLSCAAAQKNLLEFFQRWGMIPDEETLSYAAQFEMETRAIYYVSDASRVYRLEHGGSSLNAEGTVNAVSGSTSAVVNANHAGQVDFVLGAESNIPAEDVLGYEIVRTQISGGKTEKELAGFTTENTFSDSILTVNNRVITYEVTLVDKYLNRSAVKVLAPIKIEHDGSMEKTFWTVTTQNLETTNEAEPEEDNVTCKPQVKEPIQLAVDQNGQTTYTAVVSKNAGDAAIMMDFHRFHVISGFKYTVDAAVDKAKKVQDYAIYFRAEDGGWKEAAKGTFGDGDAQTVYFGNEDGTYVGTYRADAVKLVISGQKGSEIAISELDVLGVTGDNVDFRDTEEGIPAIGKLASAYKYGKNESDVIPEGSIIFTGSYKGNPAYNVVLLYDQNGNIVGGMNADGSLKAQQIILADVPEGGEIQDVSDGTWIYWIEPQDQTNLDGLRVRAELYRVNNAETNEGQRLVSDSLYREIPNVFPDITFTGNDAAGEE